jgi:hypothetical protein
MTGANAAAGESATLAAERSFALGVVVAGTASWLSGITVGGFGLLSWESARRHVAWPGTGCDVVRRARAERGRFW